MRRTLLFITACLVCIGDTFAAGRSDTPVTARATSRTNAATPTATSAATRRDNGSATRGVTSSVSGATRNQTTSARAATTRGSATQSTRSATISTATPRTATTTSRTTNATSATPRAAVTTTQSVRSATPRLARSAFNADMSSTLGTGYSACRDAYFACMDQFCATQDETYRRCVCSTKIDSIKSDERTLAQTSTQLQDFKDLNIDVIPKTGAEVKAMLSATAGENIAATAKDTSASAAQLAGISEVLSNTKTKSLSTLGTLDIAGDINAVWATSNLAATTNIANLTGEALYNAVHAQCVDLVAPSCPSNATLKMVISAYGMYIENDCAILSSAISKKITAANAAIRDTEREMTSARLDNYNAHNSTEINDCIAQVRTDITSDTACGTDYVHCLDISGKYLKRDTGEPIYTADFFQLANQLSLDGDILNNKTNRLFIAELEQKRNYAARGLDTCRDLADEVWDEFMRQAIVEIYQGQQERIRQVKNECLEAVNQCYDTQRKQLKDFSNIKDQLILGTRLELAEQMCKDKLDTCSNLYGGGSDGLDLLVSTMHDITSQTIANQCLKTLSEYARELCAVPKNDSTHSYPFACRVYTPGAQQYASNMVCNQTLAATNNFVSLPTTPTDISKFACPASKEYFECNTGYRLSGSGAGNKCIPDTAQTNIDCGDYPGSLYQKLVRYALQACVRPSEASFEVPATVLQDVNEVMDSIRVDMSKSLAKECERLGGIWFNIEWQDKNDPSATTGDGKHDITQHELLNYFYTETGANTKWGYCANPPSVQEEDKSGTTQD